MTELSSSMLMRIDLGKELESEPSISRDIFSSIFSQNLPRKTSQGENLEILPKTFKWQKGPDGSFPIEDGVGRQPIEGKSMLLWAHPLAWRVSKNDFKLYIRPLLMWMRFKASLALVIKLFKFVEMDSVLLVSLDTLAMNSSKVVLNLKQE
jgi:hypothetical protein